MISDVAKKRLYINLSNSIIYKDYLEFFPVSNLSEIYDIFYVFGKTIFDPEKNFIQLRFFRITRTIHALNHYCIMWYRRYSSLAFKLRAYQYFGSREEIEKTSNFGLYNGRRHEILTLIFVRVFGNRFGIFILSRVLDLFLFIESKRVCNKIPADQALMILPYHGGISLEFDFLVWLSKKSNIVSVAIQQNWDNVSSKSFLIKHPNYFLTWGKQSSAHLRTIQDFRGEIREVGCFRFNEIYREKSRIESLSKNFLVTVDSSSIFKILIVGTGPGNYDHALVASVMEIINFDLIDDFEITYRPHPFRISKSDMTSSLNSFPNLKIDIAKNDEKNMHRVNVMLDADVVVSLYSTVLLEATILNKHCVIPSYITGPKGYNTGTFVDDFSHYSGISSFGNIFVVDTERDFLNTIRGLKIHRNKIQTPEKQLNWYCKNTNTKQDVLDIITEIFN